MLSKLLDRLERRVGRHCGVRNLMSIVVIGTVIVFLADYIIPSILPGVSASGLLCFSKSKILEGQVWRVITFIFVPTGSANILLMAIGLYFDWLMGELLQNHWGTLRFNIFYTAGMLGAVIVGCISGYTSAYYLNMSLMLAMACIAPNMPLRLYGILEIRLKWLAIISIVMMALPLALARSWYEFGVLAAALINVLIFFADRMIGSLRDAWRHYRWKRSWHNGFKR